MLLISQLILNFWLTSESVTLRVVDGDASQTQKRLCLFAHYDKFNKINPYVIYYLQALRKIDCDIVFVSGCKKLDDSEIKKVLPYCAKVVLKKNIGLDFGSWKVALHHIQNVTKYEQVIFANDSVFGPLFNLETIFRQMAQKNYDVWGITDSWQHAYHLQSYFLVINKNFLQSIAFEKFWQKAPFVKDKNYIIKNFEIGFTQYAIAKGFSVGAYCDYFDIFSIAQQKPERWVHQKDNHHFVLPTNPTHAFWDVLISEFNVPFIKVDLLRNNPSSLPDIFLWPKVIRQTSDYQPELIVDYLKLSQKRKIKF